MAGHWESYSSVVTQAVIETGNGGMQLKLVLLVESDSDAAVPVTVRNRLPPGAAGGTAAIL